MEALPPLACSLQSGIQNYSQPSEAIGDILKPMSLQKFPLYPPKLPSMKFPLNTLNLLRSYRSKIHKKTLTIS